MKLKNKKSKLPAYVPCKCFKCGAEFDFSPSEAMKGGHNHGAGQCYRCKEILELKMNADGVTGYSQAWPYERPVQ